jgi:hypothetical protein
VPDSLDGQNPSSETVNQAWNELFQDVQQTMCVKGEFLSNKQLRLSFCQSCIDQQLILVMLVQTALLVD